MKDKLAIVLAVHGIPPKDFPPADRAELFRLRGRLTQSPGDFAAQTRLNELNTKMRLWPRTAENDPYHAGAMALAKQLESASGRTVIVGFNEFCAPDLNAALDSAAGLAVEKVVVMTTMMTPGGTHSEIDIPEAITEARGRHPKVTFDYLWPLPTTDLAAFLASLVNRAA